MNDFEPSTFITCNLFADLPYPSVCVSEKNLSYANAMLDNMGGVHSEMSAVSFYFYNHLVSCPDEVKMVFHKVSVVEMHHLSIFGELALQLGEDPRLWSQSPKKRGKTYWSSGYNNYSTNLDNMLHLSIQGEKGAIQKYSSQMKCINDPNVTQNLARIIKDEELHVDVFAHLYHKYCGTHKSND